MADLQEAINILLVARGVTPIVDPDSGHPDVQAARAILKRHKRGVCAKKYYFNTESGVTLSPNAEGLIKVPGGVIGLDVDANNIIMQGNLYNMTDRTNVYTEAVENLTLIYDREWEDLPIEAYDFVVARAKEEFIRGLESSILSGQAEKDITNAKALLDITELKFQDPAKETGNPLMLKWREKMIQR